MHGYIVFIYCSSFTGLQMTNIIRRYAQYHICLCLHDVQISISVYYKVLIEKGIDIRKVYNIRCLISSISIQKEIDIRIVYNIFKRLTYVSVVVYNIMCFITCFILSQLTCILRTSFRVNDPDRNT